MPLQNTPFSLCRSFRRLFFSKEWQIEKLFSCLLLFKNIRNVTNTNKRKNSILSKITKYNVGNVFCGTMLSWKSNRIGKIHRLQYLPQECLDEKYRMALATSFNERPSASNFCRSASTVISRSFPLKCDLELHWGYLPKFLERFRSYRSVLPNQYFRKHNREKRF